MSALRASLESIPSQAPQSLLRRQSRPSEPGAPTHQRFSLNSAPSATPHTSEPEPEPEPRPEPEPDAHRAPSALGREASSPARGLQSVARRSIPTPVNNGPGEILALHLLFICLAHLESADRVLILQLAAIAFPLRDDWHHSGIGRLAITALLPAASPCSAQP